MPFARLTCKGSPYEIGSSHGKGAYFEIARCIKFYSNLFQRSCKLEWEEVQQQALTFFPFLNENFPHYVEEMRGVADGAGVDLSDILALNVRTELNFGNYSDGCTALSWLSHDQSLLAQNWDWMEEQAENLVLLNIVPVNKPAVKMMTEAGIIGKIGFNDRGVGVCLNAIKALGMESSRLPCHLALRVALDSISKAAAVETLQQFGVASACHILIADPSGAEGVELSSKDLQILKSDRNGRVFHTNHFLVDHAGVKDTVWLPDSLDRIKRVRELADNLSEPPSLPGLISILSDEDNYPKSICRSTTSDEEEDASTLFTIALNLSARQGRVLLGKPKNPKDIIELSFS